VSKKEKLNLQASFFLPPPSFFSCFSTHYFLSFLLTRYPYLSDSQNDLQVFGVILACESRGTRNSNNGTQDPISQSCDDIYFDFKWLPNVVTTTENVVIPVQSSMTFVRIPLLTNYTETFVPIELEVSTFPASSLPLLPSNFTSLSTSSGSSGSYTYERLSDKEEEEFFTVTVSVFMGSPLEIETHTDRTNGIISITPYASLTMQRSGSIFVEMAEWLKVCDFLPYLTMFPPLSYTTLCPFFFSFSSKVCQFSTGLVSLCSTHSKLSFILDRG
jgi:hypothetical protein